MRYEPRLFYGDALQTYGDWPTPVVIVSDGPYGVSGFEGDLRSESFLPEWYEPHIAQWTELSTPLTTLWFWGTEVGWAEVYPVLKQYGWVYRSCHVWDKGIQHIAGNSNTQTLRKFPVVTEVCVQYVREPLFRLPDNTQVTEQQWLRAEWLRTGLPLNRANEACGVKNAATRKYLTADHLWYHPPSEVFIKLVEYANGHGIEEGQPYFSVDGVGSLSGAEWERLRAKFNCPSGITNVWSHPTVRGTERIKVEGKALHPNQKPLQLMRLIVKASSDPDDVVWEPFGGLCSGSVAATELNRQAFAAEIDKAFYEAACLRLVAPLITHKPIAKTFN